MKKTFKGLILFVLAIISSSATSVMLADNDTHLFPYPVVPDDESLSLSQRCNYLVYNFWDRCNIKESFSHMGKLNEAFGTWLSFMPYATADTVHLSIDNYIKAVEKAAPKQIIDIARMAESWMYCDTAQYMSEELYEPFCAAVARSKKVSNAEKARFQAQLKILQSSGLGKMVPAFDFTKPDGTKGNFGDVIASRVVLFFNDPDCVDCMMLKARLSADYSINKLIENGLIKIVSIYPGDATAEWCEIAKSYPDNWVVGANADIDTYFDIPETPILYYLDGRHKVLGKNVNIDNLMFALTQVYNQQTQKMTPIQQQDTPDATE